MSTQSLPETFRLGPFDAVPRLWTGLWQLSSNAWGSAPASKVRAEMPKYAERGYTAFDMVRRIARAIILPTLITYQPFSIDTNIDRRIIMAALRYFLSVTSCFTNTQHLHDALLRQGQFRQTVSPGSFILGATKWCVFRPIDPSPTVVKSAVNERMTRMQTRQIDLLQFHWQDYQDKGYIKALRTLLELRDEGSIAALGLCNFDSIRTDEICTELGPQSIVSNQVQFSIIDTRPLHGMNHVCEKHDVKLLTYGTLCGGFLADRWLNQPEPDLYSSNLTPSQRKYLDMILKAWGDWHLFQVLLNVLRSIGDRHGGLSIANIATRWVLDYSFVGAVIVGARLGLSDHTIDNLKVFNFSLTDQDNADIEAVLSRSRGHQMIISIGDCGMEYR